MSYRFLHDRFLDKPVQGVGADTLIVAPGDKYGAISAFVGPIGIFVLGGAAGALGMYAYNKHLRETISGMVRAGYAAPKAKLLTYRSS